MTSERKIIKTKVDVLEPTKQSGEPPPVERGDRGSVAPGRAVRDARPTNREQE